MKDFNPFNFMNYKELAAPPLLEIIKFININKQNDLFEKWDNEIKKLYVKPKNYFDSISHHLFITPYLKDSEYIDKIKTIPNINIILEKLSQKEEGLWFEDKDKDF